MKTHKATDHVDLGFLAAVLEDIYAWRPDLHGHFDDDLVRIDALLSSRGQSLTMIDFPESGKLLDFGLSSGAVNSHDLPPPVRGKVDYDSDHCIYPTLLFRKLWGDIFHLGGLAYHQQLVDEGLALEDDHAWDPAIWELREEVDPNAVFFLRQLLYMFKKVDKPCGHEREAEAAAEFIDIDRSLRRSTADWACDYNMACPVVSGAYTIPAYYSWFDSSWRTRVSFRDAAAMPGAMSYDELVAVMRRDYLGRWLDAYSDRFAAEMPLYDLWDVLPKHGPGAVSDGQVGSFDKFLFPTWNLRLDMEFPCWGFASASETFLPEPFVENDDDPRGELAKIFDLTSIRDEVPSKLIAVPKTLKGPRLIASEPTANQFLQQGLGRWLRLNMPRSLQRSVNFKDQVPSREACLEASRTGLSATVDLSSASDRLSLWTVERILRSRPDLLRALAAVRTREIFIPASFLGNDLIITLRKFAPQGNGVTFPLQTIVYAVIACTAVAITEAKPDAEPTGGHLTRRRLKTLAGKVRVFGDDIIVPAQAVPVLRELLDLCQLKVNVVKTHTQGLFRESCGMDAFAGNDVTPVYLSALSLKKDKKLLKEWRSREKDIHPSARANARKTFLLNLIPADALSSWVDVSNNAYRAGLWNLASYMDQLVPRWHLKRLPTWYEDIGILTRMSYCRGHLPEKIRWNTDHQVCEAYGFSPRSIPRTRQRRGHEALLSKFLEMESHEEQDWSYLLAGPSNASHDRYLVKTSSVLRMTWAALHYKW